MSDRPTIAVNDDLHLSPLEPADKPAMVRHLADRAIYERTLRIPFPYRDEDADKFLAIASRETQKHGHPVHFAIRQDGALIGALGFESLVHAHRAEIGYWLGRPYWGQGLMTAAVGAACRFAIAEWKLVRITAHVFEFNAASARVLEKNGFVLEGHLKKHFRKDGKFIDVDLYALCPP